MSNFETALITILIIYTGITIPAWVCVSDTISYKNDYIQELENKIDLYEQSLKLIEIAEDF